MNDSTDGGSGNRVKPSDGWDNPIRRRDGVAIRKVFIPSTDGGETFEILPGGGRPPVVFCPCCDFRFPTLRAAQLAADVLFPPGEEFIDVFGMDHEAAVEVYHVGDDGVGISIGARDAKLSVDLDWVDTVKLRDFLTFIIQAFRE